MSFGTQIKSCEHHYNWEIEQLPHPQKLPLETLLLAPPPPSAPGNYLLISVGVVWAFPEYYINGITGYVTFMFGFSFSIIRFIYMDS